MTARDKQARKYVDEFVHDFCDFNDTSMLCIYNLNSDDDCLSFCGDAEDMVRPFTGMLLAACDAEKHDGLSQLAASLFCALSEVIDSERNEDCAKFYRDLLQKLLNGEFKQPKKKPEVHKKEETFEELKAKLNKMGYNVSRKPTSKPQPKGTKK